MRACLSAMVLALCVGVLTAADRPAPQLPAETAAKKEERMQWWLDARFGMFIHWGLYSLAARHEWVKNYERMPDDDYQKYFDHFDPDLYDPREWAEGAKAAGMKYFVITTKHHEGFCLWDSKFTDYKATKTPYGNGPAQADGRGVSGRGAARSASTTRCSTGTTRTTPSTATTRSARQPTRRRPRRTRTAT